MMRDYAMDLANIAASIVNDVMGSNLKVKNSYSSDGNHIIMEFDGYPLIRADEREKPLCSFHALPSMYVKRHLFCPVQQAQCHYYQEQLGKQFAHPHVYNDGHPCWDNSKRERATDFIANIV